MLDWTRINEADQIQKGDTLKLIHNGLERDFTCEDILPVTNSSGISTWEIVVSLEPYKSFNEACYLEGESWVDGVWVKDTYKGKLVEALGKIISEAEQRYKLIPSQADEHILELKELLEGFKNDKL